MNPSILILVAMLVASSVYAEPKKKESGFQKVLKTMFPSAKPKIVPRKRKHTTRSVKPLPKQTPSPTNHIYVPVDVNWMAKYWEEEAAWDYYIPEDDLVRFKDGNYVVPIVVYKHYEDMVKTPRRSPSPKPTPPVKLEG